MGRKRKIEPKESPYARRIDEYIPTSNPPEPGINQGNLSQMMQEDIGNSNVYNENPFETAVRDLMSKTCEHSSSDKNIELIFQM